MSMSHRPQGWARRWPQCRLLVQLVLVCVEAGGTSVCRRAAERIARCRARMADAPVAVDSLLAELGYAVSLRLSGNLPAAQVHAARAVLKAVEIERLLPTAMASEAREWSRRLRRASEDLCLRIDTLLARSEAALARSAGLRRRPLPRRAAAG
jgi:hypothetical protein